MRRPNCHTNSLWFSFCSLHLSGQTFTLHVHFHACLFILLHCERTVSLYVFGRTSIQDSSFHLRTGRLQSVLVPHCAAVSYFQNTRVSFASDSIPFNSCVFSEAPLAYISLSEHQRADSFFSAFKRTFLFFPPPFFFIAAISLLFF